MQEGRKTALVVGMARSGIGSAKLLSQNGWRVIINDIKAEIDGLFEALSGIDYIDALGKPPETLLFGVDLMVITPVIPIFAPFAQKAREMGIEVIGEIELGYRFCDPGTKFVCISGTNGKTTTTAMTGEIFKASGRRTFVLGNIGEPITEYAMQTKSGDVIVAETAALQLESIDRFHANAAGMLNITEDHLNRFENKMENYIAAKCRVFENQTEGDFAVLNFDDPVVRGMQERTKARVWWFSTKDEVEEGIFIRSGRMLWRSGKGDVPLIDISELKIPGEHNVQNALCAAALALCMGVEPACVRAALTSFSGVEHRIEFVREKSGISYVNDSKSTNPASAIKAVQAMKQPTILLLGVGNYDKHSDFMPLFAAFGKTVKGVVVSGSNSPAILSAALRSGFTNIRVCGGTFSDMVNMAADMADIGYTVLLSPAAASWGMFADYEERGRAFKDIVNRL